ncbi:MAG: hypothetical protein NVS3B25_07280 [Hymenobacter sp.]
MTLDDTCWQLLTANVGHKQALLAYAAHRGVPVAHAAWGWDVDNDLYLSWFSSGIGLGALPTRHASRPTTAITEAEFLACVEAYAPPQPSPAA